MTREQSSPEVLEERATRCLEIVVVLAIPLLFSGMVGILLMSEGEETRAVNSVGPVWDSWLFIWWCFTTWGCLLGCFLWRKRQYERTVALLPGESKELTDTARDTGADQTPWEGVDESGAPPPERRMGGYVADLVIWGVVAAILSSAIVWVWPDPYGDYWRPSIRALLDDHDSFVRRRIRISGIVRSDRLLYPGADRPGGERMMVLDDEGATLEIWYNEQSASRQVRVGDRVEIVGYVFDRGPAPWSFNPAQIYRVD